MDKETLISTLPIIAKAIYGTASLADGEGRALASYDMNGKKIGVTEHFFHHTAFLAARTGKPQQGLVDRDKNIRVWAWPIGEFVIITCSLVLVEQEKQLLDTLRGALPLLSQVVSGEAVIFDKEGKRLYSADNNGRQNPEFIGKVSEAAKKTMKSRRPTVSPSLSIPGAVAVRIPVGENFGLGINNEESVKSKKKLLSDVWKLQYARYTFEDIYGKSQAITECKETARAVASSNSSVLIFGETGAGKELFAQAIHNESQRKSRPFVALNCGALPSSLIESTLFGYVEGAFTGAGKNGMAGSFEQANGGTIFLDEIGEMDLELQKKILRVLQERVVTRIGSSQSIPLDIRVISSTNRDIKEMVREKTFREDLYFRLNVIELVIPPLCRRKEDIPILIDYFIKRYNRLLTKMVVGAKSEVYEACQSYSWPGNIRELQNCVEYAMNVCEKSCHLLDIQHLPSYITNPRPEPEVEVVKAAAPPESAAEEKGLKLAKSAIERYLILEALKNAGGNKRACAQLLNMSASTLWRKMRKYGITEESRWKVDSR